MATQNPTGRDDAPVITLTQEQRDGLVDFVDFYVYRLDDAKLYVRHGAFDEAREYIALAAAAVDLTQQLSGNQDIYALKLTPAIVALLRAAAPELEGDIEALRADLIAPDSDWTSTFPDHDMDEKRASIRQALKSEIVAKPAADTALAEVS